MSSLCIGIKLQELAASQLFVFKINLRPARVILARIRVVLLIELISVFAVFVLHQFVSPSVFHHYHILAILLHVLLYTKFVSLAILVLSEQVSLLILVDLH